MNATTTPDRSITLPGEQTLAPALTALEEHRSSVARNAMLALDFATQAQEMKAIGDQPDHTLGSVHAVTGDGTLVIASASGSQLRQVAGS